MVDVIVHGGMFGWGGASLSLEPGPSCGADGFEEVALCGAGSTKHLDSVVGTLEDGR